MLPSFRSLHHRHYLRHLWLCVLVFSLSSCYLPTDFVLDIRVTRNGDFAVRYQGEVLSVALAEKIDGGEVSSDADVDDEGVIPYQRDLEVIKKFEDVEYLGDGRFSIRYLHLGSLVDSPYFVFISRLNRLMTIKMDPQEKVISLLGGGMTPEDLRRLTSAEISIKGKVRLITDLPPVNHNAGQVFSTKTPLYEWEIGAGIGSVDVPFMVLAFDPAVAAAWRSPQS